jgi:hypothetical protein
LSRLPQEGDPSISLARRLSSPGEAIAAWGDMRHSFWFDLGRPAGMRLFHPGGFLNGTLYRLLCDRMLTDLETRRPALIIEKDSVVPLFETPHSNATLQQGRPPTFFEGWEDARLTARKQELKRMYEAAGRDGPYVAWRLKRALEAPPRSADL